MSLKISLSKAIIKRHLFQQSFSHLVLRGALLSASSLVAISAQAVGLGELFSHNSAAQSKFLSVDDAFGVSSHTKATPEGTRVSIAFDITPAHYVYKDKLSVRFPKGIRAAPLTFSQPPVFINDPTFGQVPVFTQRRVVATTTLTTNNGKAAKNVPIMIGWQGCAKAGLCYPPEKINTKVTIVPTRK